VFHLDDFSAIDARTDCRTGFSAVSGRTRLLGKHESALPSFCALRNPAAKSRLEYVAGNLLMGPE
jgi:hypothetical protein